MEGSVGEPDHLRLLDLFSGIGGFHLGIERAGHKIGWSGFCEIDKYASAVYRRRFPDAQELGDVRSVQGKELPKIDIITFGSPCQDFSIAGKRAGMGGSRSSLISEAIRLIDECRPGYFIWENVKGTFSSNNRQDFAAILQAFANIGGYRLEWQLLNTRWVLPQNRERIFLVGYTGGGSGSKIFPIGETSQVTNHRNAEVASTLQHPGHSGGNYRGMTMINTVAIMPESDKPKGNYLPRERVLSSDGIARAVSTSKSQHPYYQTGLKQVGTIGKDSESTRVYDIARTIKDGGGMGSKTGLYKVHNTQTRNPNRPSLTRKCDCGSGKLYKKCCGVDGGSGHISKDDGTTYCLDTGNTQAVEYQSSIRRLTPKECERLQGFPDDWTSEGIINGEVVKMSDTQRYKQCGNAVTVDIVSLVAKRLKHDLQ